MKKILISFIISMCLFINVWAYTKNDINNIMNSYYQMLEKKTFFYKKTRIMSFLDKVSLIESKLSDSNKNKEILLYIKNSLNDYFYELNDFNLSKYSDYSYSNIIIRFDNSFDYNKEVILNNQEKIKNSFSVFLFRNKENIDFDIMKKSISLIKEINPDILLFIDQEWWFINRYKDFSSVKWSFYYSNDYIYNKYKKLDELEKSILDSLISWIYYPSNESINESYKKISDNNKQDFLDILAFIKLKNLDDVWINTHWLVLDLDLWNPVITWLSRSFSSDIEEYKKLIDSYIWASNMTWVLVYAKHFPWHWDWNVDSHDSVLIYDDNIDYLNKNIELFDYFLSKSLIKSWIMVGHMYLPNDLKDEILNIALKSDFILTDDLAMSWYKNHNSFLQENMFFSTTNILDTDNIFIKVDTSNNFTWIK